MRFEVYAQYGRNWSYRGIYTATTPRTAAYDCKTATGRNVIKLRPEDSRDKFLVYRFSAVPK